MKNLIIIYSKEYMIKIYVLKDQHKKHIEINDYHYFLFYHNI